MNSFGCSISASNSKTLVYRWTIENFLPLDESGDKTFQIDLLRLTDSRWSLEILPNSPKGKIQVRLSRNKQGDQGEVVVAFTIYIEKADGTKCTRRPAVCKITETRNGVTWYMNLSPLLQQKSQFFPSDGFTMYLLLMIPFPLGRANDERMVTNGLAAMLVSGNYSDFTIHVEKETFKVHRFILARNSPFFATLFEKKMGMSDFIMYYDPKLIEVFLQFFYSGKVNVTESNVYELYRMACKYCVSKLKTLCVVFMAQNLSTDNLCDVAAFAKETGDTDIIDFVMGFLEDNKSFFLTPKWESFMKVHCHAANKFLKRVVFKLKFSCGALV